MSKRYASTGGALEETKRTARILEIVQVIATAPRRYLRRDLASRFEVSERMIQKDLEIIRHGLRLPLRHSAQGYYFEATPRLPTLQYSFSEALALLLAVQAGRQVSGIDSTELAAAIARLEALFPSEFTPLLRRFSSPRAATPGILHRQEMLRILSQALAERRKVQVVYVTASRGGEISERVVHPYYILPYVRSWHLVAYCERRRKTLIFKVDRIRSAKVLEERYRIPEDFDVETYLGKSWGIMRMETEEPVDVVLRFAPQAARWVTEEDWGVRPRVEAQPDGTVIFRMHVVVTPELVNWILYYGSQVEVLAPTTLQKQVMEEHLRAAQQYRGM